MRLFKALLVIHVVILLLVVKPLITNNPLLYAEDFTDCHGSPSDTPPSGCGPSPEDIEHNGFQAMEEIFNNLNNEHKDGSDTIKDDSSGNTAEGITAENDSINKKEESQEASAETANNESGSTTGDPVLISSGKFLLDETDITIPGASLTVSRRYINGGAPAGSFGDRWRSALDSRIIRGRTIINMPKEISFNEELKQLEALLRQMKSYSDREARYAKSRAIAARMKQRYAAAEARHEEVLGLVAENKTLYEALRKIYARSALLGGLNERVLFPGTPPEHEGVGNENLTLIDEAGAPCVFEPAGQGVWLPMNYPEREYLRLESLDRGGAESTAGFVLHQRGGRKKYYNGYGLLVRVEELNGRALELERGVEGRLTLIKGPHGDEWQVTYSGSFISRIAGPEGADVRYTYSGNELTGVRDVSGDTIRYVYTGGRLLEIIKPDNSSIKLAYGAESSDGTMMVTSTSHEEGASEYFSYYPSQRLTIHRNHSEVQTRYYYDANHKTVREEHGNGTVKTLTYDSQGRLGTETYNGFTIRYSYDTRGNISHKTYGDGTSESWTWNEQDQPLRYSDRDRVVTEWRYDLRGNRTEVRRGGELVFTGSYDARNRLLTSRNGDRGEVRYVYNTRDFPVSRSMTVNGQSITERWEYDGLGRIVKYTDGLERVWEYTYTQKETIQRTPEGLLKRYVYNNRKQLVRVVQTDTLTGEVREQRIEYDRRHLPLKVTDGAGVVTSYEYRADGNMVRQERGVWNWEYSYEAGGRISSVTQGMEGSGARRTAEYQYNRQGWNEERSVTVSGGGTNAYHIDVFGRVTGTTNALGETSSRTLNSAGNPLREQGASGGFYTYRYDSSGRPVEAGREGEIAVHVRYNRDGTVAEKTDRLGNVTRYVYDARGLLAREITPLGEHRYYYDAANRVVRQESASRNSVTYYTDWLYNDSQRTVTITSGGTYTVTVHLNAWGEVVRTVDGEGVQYRYEYDGAGRLLKVIDGYGRETKYAWNEINKISTITHSDGAAEIYEYDHLGNVTQTKDALGISWMGQYDEAGRLIKETGRPGIDRQYRYDAVGRIIEVRNGEEVVERYRYTNRGREVVFTDGTGNDFTQRKNAFGELTQEFNRTGDTQRYSYDGEGRAVALTSYSGKQTQVEYRHAEGLDFTPKSTHC
jgi:YD repeat-containing protein